MFAWFVRPLLATILWIWEIWSPHIHVSCISLLAKKHTDFEADRWPETDDFLGCLIFLGKSTLLIYQFWTSCFDLIDLIDLIDILILDLNIKLLYFKSPLKLV